MIWRGPTNGTKQALLCLLILAGALPAPEGFVRYHVATR